MFAGLTNVQSCEKKEPTIFDRYFRMLTGTDRISKRFFSFSGAFAILVERMTHAPCRVTCHACEIRGNRDCRGRYSNRRAFSGSFRFDASRIWGIPRLLPREEVARNLEASSVGSEFGRRMRDQGAVFGASFARRPFFIDGFGRVRSPCSANRVNRVLRAVRESGDGTWVASARESLDRHEMHRLVEQRRIRARYATRLAGLTRVESRRCSRYGKARQTTEKYRVSVWYVKFFRIVSCSGTRSLDRRSKGRRDDRKAVGSLFVRTEDACVSRTRGTINERRNYPAVTREGSMLRIVFLGRWEFY